MINRFKIRNFDGHDCFRPVIPLSFVKSDTSYDQNKGVTHSIVKDPDSDNHRIISDVEIAMSDSPEVTSLFTREHRMALRNKLMNQPHSPVHPAGVTDDDLIKLATPALEMDERLDLAKSRSQQFFDNATDKVLDDVISKSKSSPAAPDVSTPE